MTFSSRGKTFVLMACCWIKRTIAWGVASSFYIKQVQRWHYFHHTGKDRIWKKALRDSFSTLKGSFSHHFYNVMQRRMKALKNVARRSRKKQVLIYPAWFSVRILNKEELDGELRAIRSPVSWRVLPCPPLSSSFSLTAVPKACERNQPGRLWRIILIRRILALERVKP